MKGEKSALWEKAPIPAGKREGANELLEKVAGGKISMAVGSGAEPGGGEGKKLGYKKMAPTIKDDSKEPGPAKSKSAKAGAYAGELGTGKEKESKMAQKVGSPRKGY